MSTPTVTRNVVAPPQPASGLCSLVTPPEPARRLPSRGADDDASVGDRAPAVWLLGAHGGAGVSSLRRAGADAHDAGRYWPTHGLVVVVCRSTAYGLEWARDAARQHASGCLSQDVSLGGLVVVADAPGRMPRRVSRFLDLLTAAYPRVWQVPWVEEWRLAGWSEDLPSPPAVRQLDHDLQALIGAGSTPTKE